MKPHLLIICYISILITTTARTSDKEPVGVAQGCPSHRITPLLTSAISNHRFVEPSGEDEADIIKPEEIPEQPEKTWTETTTSAVETFGLMAGLKCPLATLLKHDKACDLRDFFATKYPTPKSQGEFVETALEVATNQKNIPAMQQTIEIMDQYQLQPYVTEGTKQRAIHELQESTTRTIKLEKNLHNQESPTTPRRRTIEPVLKAMAALYGNKEVDVATIILILQNKQQAENKDSEESE